jgi:hypothetical protein
MRNVWVKYTVLRLGVFSGLCILLIVLGMPWLFAVVISGMLSFAYSLFFLTGLRDQISKQIYEKRNNSLGSGDPESDLENEIVDSKAKGEHTPTQTNSKE